MIDASEWKTSLTDRLVAESVQGVAMISHGEHVGSGPRGVACPGPVGVVVKISHRFKFSSGVEPLAT